MRGSRNGFFLVWVFFNLEGGFTFLWVFLFRAAWCEEKTSNRVLSMVNVLGLTPLDQARKATDHISVHLFLVSESLPIQCLMLKP